MSMRVATGPVEIRKVAIVGPECTGKSTLARQLAEHYQTVWVQEYARGYLDNLVRPYERRDLRTISHGQLRLEESWARRAQRVLICDTNLLVIKIWSDFKYGETDSEILESMKLDQYGLHLLTYIDVPWEDDPQREHPDKRAALYDIYLRELASARIPFTEIRGSEEQRMQLAIQAIDKMLATP